MKVKYKFSNGDKVSDKVTGFTGVITGAATYLTGCNQYLITAKVKDEFSEAKSNWFDEGRINIIIPKELKGSDVKASDNGSDIPALIK